MESKKIRNSAWRDLDARLLWIYEDRVHSSSSNAEIRNCEYFSVWRLNKGCVDMEFADGQSYRVDAGNWVALVPGMKKSQLFSEDAEIVSVAFIARWPDGSNLLKVAEPVIFSSGHETGFEHAVYELRDYISQNVDFNYMRQSAAKIDFTTYAYSNLLFWKFIESWYNIMDNKGCGVQMPEDLDPRLRPALFILRKHHFNQPLPYEQLCRQSGLSRSHFDRLFVEQFGQSPKKFCESICLEDVIRLLSTSSISVKEAAFEAGFVNVSHFCTWFKRKTSHSPEEYRRFLV